MRDLLNAILNLPPMMALVLIIGGTLVMVFAGMVIVAMADDVPVGAYVWDHIVHGWGLRGGHYGWGMARTFHGI